MKDSFNNIFKNEKWKEEIKTRTNKTWEETCRERAKDCIAKFKLPQDPRNNGNNKNSYDDNNDEKKAKPKPSEEQMNKEGRNE